MVTKYYVGFGVELTGSSLLIKLIHVAKDTVSSKTAGIKLVAECWIGFAVDNFLEEGR